MCGSWAVSESVRMDDKGNFLASTPDLQNKT